MMRWGFKLPDRLLFNARSEGIAQANFWKDAFLTGRAHRSRRCNLRVEEDAGRAEEAEVRDHHTGTGALRHGGRLEALEVR